MGKCAAEIIELAVFDDVLSHYTKHVKPDLKELDHFRFEDLPERIQKRKSASETSNDAVELITKAELVDLVTWKLKHGTFRPKLKSLIESNDEETISKIMRDLSVSKATPKDKLSLLTQLKGIGPATASLVLSCIWPLHCPFFSDELFRWMHWDGKNADGDSKGIKAGKGWARPIGYTPKEYESLVARCQEVQARLSEGREEQISFLDMEKVAYVVGKEKVDVDGGDEFAGEDEDGDENSPVKETSTPPKASRKRRPGPADEKTYQTGRSKRTKK